MVGDSCHGPWSHQPPPGGDSCLVRPDGEEVILKELLQKSLHGRGSVVGSPWWLDLATLGDTKLSLREKDGTDLNVLNATPDGSEMYPGEPTYCVAWDDKLLWEGREKLCPALEVRLVEQTESPGDRAAANSQVLQASGAVRCFPFFRSAISEIRRGDYIEFQ
eukprot:Skav224299  [mRNA]  locus=scaffold2121:212830:214852:+ [translate_table: standard]